MSLRGTVICCALALQALAAPLAAAPKDRAEASAASDPVAAPAGGIPIVVGQSYTLASSILGDRRRLNVWLPPGYAEGKKRYPVLVLLDGGSAEDFLHIAALAQITSAYGRGQELIVVGIEGVDRRHDLSPPTDDPADLRFTKAPGGAGQYRRFLAEEVRPWISAHYRTDGHAALIGESMAGLFVLDTLAATPEAFDDYIAISPTLFWNRQALSRTLAKAPPAMGKDRRLFVAFEGSMTAGPGGPTPAQQAEERVESALHGRPSITLVRFAQERHDTIYHPAALAALRALYTLPSDPGAK